MTHGACGLMRRGVVAGFAWHPRQRVGGGGEMYSVKDDAGLLRFAYQTRGNPACHNKDTQLLAAHFKSMYCTYIQIYTDCYQCDNHSYSDMS